MELEEYQKFVRQQREKFFEKNKPYDLIYEQFMLEGLFEKGDTYFFRNASRIIEVIRDRAWVKFQELEYSFTSQMLSSLYTENDVENLTSHEAITWFVEKFPQHIYKLNLSNTQSRRSRAGNEFEAIIELILVGANIPMDSQGNIGKQYFLDKGLGKMVDIVAPGSTEYLINKRDTILISAKTSLRERWQEVPEEMVRTGAREMFLVTLDEHISKEVIANLDASNIQVVTPLSVKEKIYPKDNNVISFEKLLKILNDTVTRWDDYPYTDEEKAEIQTKLKRQLEKHDHHPFVASYYQKYIEKFN